MKREKRKSFRQNTTRDVEFFVANRLYQGIMIDKGADGVFIETSAGLASGQEIFITYISRVLGTEDRKGIITRSTAKGIAVEFKFPSNNIQNQPH